MAGVSKKLDLNEEVHKPDKKVKVQVESLEHPTELRSRLRREEAKDNHDHRRELMVLSFVLIVLGVMVLLCAWISVSATTSTDDKKWAAAILSSIVTGGIGFLTGKNMAR